MSDVVFPPDEIKRLRESQNLTLDGLAAKAGLLASALQRAEQGHAVSITTAKLLKEALPALTLNLPSSAPVSPLNSPKRSEPSGEREPYTKATLEQAINEATAREATARDAAVREAVDAAIREASRLAASESAKLQAEIMRLRNRWAWPSFLFLTIFGLLAFVVIALLKGASEGPGSPPRPQCPRGQRPTSVQPQPAPARQRPSKHPAVQQQDRTEHRSWPS
jgi:transcriptional regulator with XRE-family HTH domain